MAVEKAFKYRFSPTVEQATQLAKIFGCARYIYNHALEDRTKAWRQEKKSIGYHVTAAKLSEWKKEPDKAFLSKVGSEQCISCGYPIEELPFSAHERNCPECGGRH